MLEEEEGLIPQQLQVVLEEEVQAALLVLPLVQQERLIPEEGVVELAVVREEEPLVAQV
jgi:hypothetical protein